MQKPLLFLFLLFLSFFCRAQISIDPCVNFDDTSYKSYIIIDTVNANNNWQIGKPLKPVFDTAYSLQRAIVTDTMNQYLINDTSIFYLKLRTYIFGSPGYAWFSMITFKFQIDKDSGDKLFIDYHRNDTSAWSPIIDTNLLKPTSGWKNFTALLDPPNLNATTYTHVRFTFVSDSAQSLKDGWIIDDLCGYYQTAIPKTLTVIAATIYPNPATEQLIIETKSQQPYTIWLQDIMGRTVKQAESRAGKAVIDVTDIPAAMYSVKLCEDGDCVYRNIMVQHP